MKQVLTIVFIGLVFLGYGQLIDERDGKTYKTVKIGDQLWMAENLHSFYFQNGDPIPIVKSKEAWDFAAYTEKPACCYYENKSENGDKYGLIYNWYAVNDPRGLAPKSWHIPSGDEKDKLIEFVGGIENGLLKLKSISGWENDWIIINCLNCSKWKPEEKAGKICDKCSDTRKVKSFISGNGTNSTGFNASPGGYIALDNGPNTREIYFYDIGHYSGWWVMDRKISNDIIFFGPTPLYSSVICHYDGTMGFYVRCIKD